MPTATANPSAVANALAALQQALAALPDERDVPNTIRAQEELSEQKRLLSGRVHLARTAIAKLAKLEPQVAALTKYHADLTALRKEFSRELLALPAHSTDRRELARIHGLKVSIRCIDGRFDMQSEAIPTDLPLFAKLLERGYVAPPHAPWNPMAALYGSLPVIEDRLAELEPQQDAAQATLDNLVQETSMSTV